MHKDLESKPLDKSNETVKKKDLPGHHSSKSGPGTPAD